jgi:hypothetical protein
METVDGIVLVVASLAAVTADLPQGNDLAGVKRHGAIHGCRACNVSRDQLTDDRYDYVADARFHQLTNTLFEELSRQRTASSKESMATAYGKTRLCNLGICDVVAISWNDHVITQLPRFSLPKSHQYRQQVAATLTFVIWPCFVIIFIHLLGLSLLPRPLDALARDRHRHIPHDAYHSMAGKALRLLDTTFEHLSTVGETAWLRHWKAIEKPPGWGRLPNPVTHRGSFQFSDGLRLAMIMPFVLLRSLSPGHLKADKLATIKARLGLVRDSQVCKEFVQLWAVEAKALRLAFRTTFGEGDYERLRVSLEEERKALLRVSCHVLLTMIPPHFQAFVFFFFFFFIAAVSGGVSQSAEPPRKRPPNGTCAKLWNPCEHGGGR